MRNPFSLESKTALVTGGAGLLGVEHSSALLESGATLVLTDVSSASLRSARDHLAQEFGNLENRLIPLELDVTEEESIREVEARLQQFGLSVDILINNAALNPKVGSGGLEEHSRLEDLSVEYWERQMAVGLRGAFLCSRIFGSAMAARGYGVILNVASDLSIIAPDQRLYSPAETPPGERSVKPVTYSVIKAGLIGLTRYIATYWPEQGVRCNAISPGGVLVNQPSAFVQLLCDRIPLGRMARPKEYRSAIQFLCSDASAYMTGHNLVMDGGRSVW